METSVVSTMDSNQRIVTERLDAVSSYVKNRRFPRILGRRVRRGRVASRGSAAREPCPGPACPVEQSLEQLRPGSRVSRVEYRAFKQTGVMHPLELYRVDKKTHALIEDPDAAARMDRALTTAGKSRPAAR